MVEIFKTNVADKSVAEEILKTLSQRFPDCKFNFDLQDCDRILRLEYEVDQCMDISLFLTDRGWQCSLIE